MSSSWSHNTLSASSSDSDGEPDAKKSKRVELSSGGSGDEQVKRKSRSRSKSGSGSDSGTARSKSSSRSGSRSGSGGRASRGGSSDSGTGGSRPPSPQQGRRRSRSGSSSRASSPATKKPRSRSPSDSPTSDHASHKKKSGGDKIYTSSSSSSQQSDSSSNSKKGKKLKKSKDHKVSSKLEAQLSNPDSEDEVAVKEKRKTYKKKGQKQKEQSSEEEGTWRDEFDDGLDDDLIGDLEDRRMLESLTEREREEEFYKRNEKRDELKKRFEITQKLKKQQQKRRGSSSDVDSIRDEGHDRADSALDSYQDPHSRKKGYEEKYGSKFSALSELKAKREEKERKEKLREEKIKKNKKNISDSESGSDYEKLGKGKNKKNVLKASEIYSSSSSDDGGDVRRKTSSSSSSDSSSESGGESDTERQNSKKTVKKALNIETKEEIEKIRLSRFKLDKFVHLPIFKKTVIGCYVRVGIGRSPEGKDVYRCCEIVDTCETGKIYNVMKSKTNLGLKLRHGKDTRIFRLQFISNNPLSESEFEKYKKACVDGNTSLPTNAHVAQKQKDIKYALEYRFSTADVEKILASKKKFDNNPKNYAMKKAELTKLRDMAAFTGEKEKERDYSTELDNLEKRAEDLDSKRTSSISTISFINDRNRKNNVVRAYKGIMEEVKQKEIDGEVDDPFTRRKTRPRLGNTKSKVPDDIEMTSELLNKLEAEKKAAMTARVLPNKTDIAAIGEYGVKMTKKIEVVNKHKQVDIFDAHDFELDINVDDINQSTPITPSISLKPVTASTSAAGPTKRSLKLDEWKKKRGII